MVAWSFLPVLAIWALLALLSPVAQAKEQNLAIELPALAGSAADRQKRAEARLAATPVDLPAGSITLADAVAALAASGNPTRLAAGLDPARTATLTAAKGTYWQAVAQVCAAFQVEPLPGMTHFPVPEIYNQDGEFLPVQLGPVEFIPAPARSRTRLVPCGAALALVQEAAVVRRRVVGGRGESAAWIQATVAVRLEPRVAGGILGSTVVAWGEATEPGGKILRLANDRNENQGVVDATRLRLESPSVDVATATVAAELRLGVIEAWSSESALAPGDAINLTLGEQRLVLALAKQNDGMQLSLKWTEGALLGNPQLRLIRDGAVLPNKNTNTDSNNNTLTTTLTLGDPSDVVHQARVSGHVRLGQVAFPLRIPLDLAPAPADAAPNADPALAGTTLPPSRVRWAAGEATLLETLGRLSADGQAVMLEVGIDGQRRAMLPAIDGTWWEAVVATCRTFALTIMPPAKTEEGRTTEERIVGGPLSLAAAGAGRPGLGTFQTCGPVLVEVLRAELDDSRGLGSRGRSLHVRCRLRLEPKADPGRIGPFTIAWDSLARVGDQALPVRDGDAGGNSASIRSRRFDGEDVSNRPQDGHAARIDRLPAGRQTVRLTGQAVPPLLLPQRIDLRLVPGVWTTRPFGAGTLSATVATAAQTEAFGLPPRASLLVVQGGVEDDKRLDLTGPDSKAIKLDQNGTTQRNGRNLSAFTLPADPVGEYALSAKDTLTTGDARLPITVTVELPE